MGWVQWDQHIRAGQHTGRAPTREDQDTLRATRLDFVRRLQAGRLPGETWRRSANCVGHVDLFFPEWPDVTPEEMNRRGHDSVLKEQSHTDRDERLSAARALCAACPVRLECLGWAFRVPEEKDPVLGGLSWNQRKKVLSGIRGAICCPGSRRPLWHGSCEHCHQPHEPDDTGLVPVHVCPGIPRTPYDAHWKRLPESDRRRYRAHGPTRQVIPLSDRRARLGNVGLIEPLWALVDTRWRTSAGRTVTVATISVGVADLPRSIGGALHAEAALRGEQLGHEDADLALSTIRLRTPSARLPIPHEVP